MRVDSSQVVSLLDQISIVIRYVFNGQKYTRDCLPLFQETMALGSAFSIL